MEQEEKRMLVRAALDARGLAYAPYSGYTVGAALLADGGEIYLGGNIENASYGATNCAERTCFFKAVSEGKRSFQAIAIAGGLAGEVPTDFAAPCGICRQVMREFASDNFLILIAKSETEVKEFTLAELLPESFGGDSIR